MRVNNTTIPLHSQKPEVKTNAIENNNQNLTDDVNVVTENIENNNAEIVFEKTSHQIII